MSVYETIKMSPLLGLQGSGGGLAYLAGLSGGDKTYVDDVFGTFLYEGDAVGGGDTQTINNGIDLAGEGGLVWIKSRSVSGREHILIDTERGATKYISSNQTSEESTGSNHLNLFNNNGFRVGGDSTVNENNQDFVSWSFRKAPGFFDVVTYTGNGASGLRAINHNLGSTPAFIIVKYLDGGSQWYCWHKNLTSKNYYILLNGSGAQGNAGTQVWEATDTTFSIHSGVAGNGVGENYVAYLFADNDASFGTGGDESIIKCGTYAGNGTATTVDIGFEPQWVLVKASDANYGWAMLDNMRGIVTGTADDRFLSANSSDEEQGQDMLDLTATGFIAKANSNTNANNKNYIYMAIRRPHKPPESATEVFSPVRPSSSGTLTATSGFATDWSIIKSPLSGGATYAGTRLTGGGTLTPHSTAAEWTVGFSWDFMDKATIAGSGDYSSWIAWNFKRAPGFFDVVAYTGTGSVTTINHNLGVAPSVVLIKGRNTTYSWYWQHYALGANTWMQLNNQEAGAGNGNIFNDTLPTSSVFSVGSLAGTNGSGNTYIAYLFGDLPGISKAGTYTGTGSNINVDCGFTAGARFVLIKRKDGSGGANVGDWYVWDSIRGIVSGNDPYLLLNSSAAQVTNTDYIDPLSSGFTVTSSAPAALNASGGTYLFLAIA